MVSEDKRDSAINIHTKLAQIQRELKAPKDLNNSYGGYKYRSAESILEKAKPLLDEQELTLTLSDNIEHVGDRFYIKVTAMLTDIHTGDFLYTTAYAREAQTKKGMDESQITGACSSYARKYALNGLFLLDDTKDADTDEFKRESDNRQAKEAKSKANTKASAKSDTQKSQDVQGESNANAKVDAKTESQDEKPKPTKAIITNEHVQDLSTRIDDAGINMSDFLKLYKKKTLDTMTEAQYKNAIDNWDAVVSRVSEG